MTSNSKANASLFLMFVGVSVLVYTGYTRIIYIALMAMVVAAITQ